MSGWVGILLIYIMLYKGVLFFEGGNSPSSSLLLLFEDKELGRGRKRGEGFMEGREGGVKKPGEGKDNLLENKSKNENQRGDVLVKSNIVKYLLTCKSIYRDMQCTCWSHSNNSSKTATEFSTTPKGIEREGREKGRERE